MSNFIGWLKNNWLTTILLLAVGLLVWKQYGDVRPYVSYDAGFAQTGIGGAEGLAVRSIGIPSPIPEAAPVASDERLVVQDTDMSLLVEDVDGAISTIEETAVSLGGYMVNKSLNQPEGAATGYITIRVPVERREEALERIRESGVRVVSENVYGFDVTDEYVDLEERISQLTNTKAKIEDLQDRATNVTDLIQIQNQLTNIQQQIDSLKGRQSYLEQTAKLTRITVNLSTDELALPYAPSEAWRPQAVFRTAVRTMVRALRLLANAVIWLVAFTPVIIVAAIIVWIIIWLGNRFMRK